MAKYIFTFLLSLFLFQGLIAQTATRKKHFNLKNGLAIEGYDPVAYFTQNKAIKGNAQIAYTLENVTYYFTNTTNKDSFIKNPKKYEPQFGGWCAYAMGATNDKVDVDPETFKIIDGKLYLYFHNWVNNTLLKWNKDEAKLKTKADKNWANMIN
jgi:YHS domain-containing protein